MRTLSSLVWSCAICIVGLGVSVRAQEGGFDLILSSEGSFREGDKNVRPTLTAPGTMVEVVHGPLAGVVGRLTRKGTQARLILAVNLIGQGVSVQVDAADVRAL